MNSLPKCLFWLLYVVALTFAANNGRREKYPEKLSAGIYDHEIKIPLVYESYAAMTFEFELPAVNVSTAPFDYSCPDDKIASNYSCPVYYHLQKLWSELNHFIELRHLRHPPSNDEIIIPSCAEITRHFHSQTTTVENIRRYKQLLRHCVQGIQATSMVKRPNDQAVFSGQQLTWSFIGTYYKDLPSNRRVDKAMLVNMLAAADGLKMTQLLQEAQEWTDAVRECKSGRIPSTKITEPFFKNVLSVLQRRLGNRELVIDPENDLSRYFTSPLTDCTLTADDRLFVRVLVPLKSTGAEWSIRSLTSVPFVYNDGEDGTPLVCTVKDGSIIGGKIYSHEKSSNQSFPVSCDVRKDDLCHSGDNEGSLASFKRSCGSEILANNQQQILKLCELHCEPIDSFRTPITLRVAADTFYIAGKVGEAVEIKCGNTTQTIYPPREGALEVHVPCECTLSATGTGKPLVSLEPCGRNLTVYTVKPMHLSGTATAVVSEEVESVEPHSRRSARL